jgi:hypothetical protein
MERVQVRRASPLLEIVLNSTVIVGFEATARTRAVPAGFHAVAGAGRNGAIPQDGCDVCHTSTLQTAAAGTSLNRGTFVIPRHWVARRFIPSATSSCMILELAMGSSRMAARRREQVTHRALVGTADPGPLVTRWECFGPHHRHPAPRRRSKTCACEI